MADPLTSARAFLEQAYADLDLRNGLLMPAGDTPDATGVDPTRWIQIGDWLVLADRIGADRVFFVGDDPVILFVALPEPADDIALLQRYREAWCLSRPECLFISTPGELRVYSLSSPPAANAEEWRATRPLAVVKRIGDVAQRLSGFQRDRVESGLAFTGSEFSASQGRAGIQLLKDVIQASAELSRAGLSLSLAHALIERVLLIRYLEDRGVVTTKYLKQVAAQNASWPDVLDKKPPTPILNRDTPGFVSILTDKNFTYAVFKELSNDFNGDLFVAVDSELDAVDESHLRLIQRMLLGDTDDIQSRLFLWAYDFSIVPTNLISTMYEQFYTSADDESNAGEPHYTPPELVEYVLNQVLTWDVLKREPRVLDPACGSGIFLVEAYRLIVRYETVRHNRRLSSDELRTLLLNRIAGIDINGEAVRLAAFSLYLAFLNYQQPQDILQAGPLPQLIRKEPEGGEGILAISDAFQFTPTEFSKTSPTPLLSGQENESQLLPWDVHSFDVLVGNPPWTEPDVPQGQPERWSQNFGGAVGDRNPSQRFIWRALSFLKSDGIAGLLVHASVISNRRATTRRFRSQWLAEVELKQVVNFSPARRLFFGRAVAPFIFVQFTPTRRVGTALSYQTVQRSRALEMTHAMSFGRLDRRLVRQDDLWAREYLWKTYAWGSHLDAGLLAQFETETALRDVLSTADPKPGYGYQYGPSIPSARLRTLRSLHPARLTFWGSLKDEWFESPPQGTKRQPDERLYEGQRIVIPRGVKAEFGPYARLEYEPFSFRHRMYCIPLHSLDDWQAKVILGVILSSLGRYRIFMTSGSWGSWYDELVPDDVLSLPIRLTTADDPLSVRVTEAVDAIRHHEGEGTEGPLFDYEAGASVGKLDHLLTELDNTVLDLFELTDAQRDLILDFHSLLDLYRKGPRSVAVQPIPSLPLSTGTIADIDSDHAPSSELGRYISVFLERWNRELGPTGELAWTIRRADSVQILCLIFSTKPRTEPVVRSSNATHLDDIEWRHALEHVETLLQRPVTSSLFTNGVVRAVSDTEIIIIKRNERRLWTATAAREDVEATMLQAMALREK